MALEFFSPLSNIAPFTYRDGETYLQRLHRLQKWCIETSETIENQINLVIETFDEGMANATEKANAAAASAAEAEATSHMMVVAQDTSVEALVKLGGLTSKALDARYANTITPEAYGAKGDGVTDDSAAVLAAMNAAAAIDSFSSAVVSPGNRNAVYALGSPVAPNSGSFNMRGLHFKSIAPLDYQVKFNKERSANNVAQSHLDITISDCTFDSNHAGGGLYLSNYLRVNVIKSRFFHATTKALHLADGAGFGDSHEAFVEGCFFAEHPFPETGVTSSTAILVESHDNHIGPNIIASASVGLKISTSYNTVNGLHVYGCDVWGIDSDASYLTFSQIYVDSCAMRINNPWHVEVIGSKFLHDTTNDQFAFIVLRPTAANTWMFGLHITNNSFHNTPAVTVESIKADTSVGSFSPFNAENCTIDNNGFVNVNRRASRFTYNKYVTGAEGDNIPINISQLVVPGLTPLSVLVGFLPDLGGFHPDIWVDNLSDIASVPVRLSEAGNGIVMLSIDCCPVN